MVEMRKDGASYRQIADAAGVHHTTVINTVKNFYCRNFYSRKHARRHHRQRRQTAQRKTTQESQAIK